MDLLLKSQHFLQKWLVVHIIDSILGGNGMSSLRLHNLLAMTLSTGSWTTFEGIDSLSPGVCSMFASVVSIDHARKANAGKLS